MCFLFLIHELVACSPKIDTTVLTPIDSEKQAKENGAKSFNIEILDKVVAEIKANQETLNHSQFLCVVKSAFPDQSQCFPNLFDWLWEEYQIYKGNKQRKGPIAGFHFPKVENVYFSSFVAQSKVPAAVQKKAHPTFIPNSTLQQEEHTRDEPNPEKIVYDFVDLS